MEHIGAWSRPVLRDVLGSIKSHLVGRNYFAFTGVCKSWYEAPSVPPKNPSSPTRLLNINSSNPEAIEIFDPLLNVKIRPQHTLTDLSNSKLWATNGNWILMSQNQIFSLYNLITDEKISLPHLAQSNQGFTAWSFSSAPDSFDHNGCFVVGLQFYCVPPAMYILKLGEATWSYHRLYENNDGGNDDERVIFLASACTNPLFFGNTICMVGDGGSLGIITLSDNSENPPTWEILHDFQDYPRVGFSSGHPDYTPPRKNKIYVAKDVDKERMIVGLTDEAGGNIKLWSYKIKREETGSYLEKEELNSLGDKTLFVSSRASYLKTCSGLGLGNTIFFPMFHGDNGVFYSFHSNKYYSFDYSESKSYSSANISDFRQLTIDNNIWIDEIEND